MLHEDRSIFRHSLNSNKTRLFYYHLVITQNPFSPHLPVIHWRVGRSVCVTSR
jgi:hypothetical protein